MESPTTDRARGSLSSAVAKSSVVAGAIAFAAGVIGTIYLSSSNLGPMAAILVTGPLGLVAGAVWGAVRWALTSADSADDRVIRILGRFWAVALFYTLFFARLGPILSGAGACMQLLTLAGLFVLCSRRGVWSPVRITAGAVIAAIFLMTLCPPVARPTFGQATVAPKTSELPIAAFIFDPRLDASRHVPELVVNIPLLLVEWVTIIAAGALAAYLIRRRKSRALSS